MKRSKKEKKKKSIYRVRWGRVILKTGLAVGLTGTFVAGYYVYDVLKDVPTVHEEALKSDSSSNMYADDTLIWTSAKYKRNYVEIEDVPQAYKDLLISTEDAEFYTNKGFSPKGLANAGLSYVKEKLGKGEARGGSGIEQQLIKLSVFSTSNEDRTITRKIKELFLSSQLYNNYSKDEILEFYVNKIFVGENAYGIQTIANVYFDKDLKNLNLSQLAIIAGLGQAPSAYNLYDNPDLVQERRDTVLYATLVNGKITQAEYDEAKETPIQEGLIPRYSKAQVVDTETSRHNAFVSSALEQIDELGYDMEVTPLQIHTTLDRTMENKVKDILDKRTDLFQGENHQAAVTITDPRTGDVIVELGGRNSNTIGGLNRATQTNRSSGSTIKPILSYGPAVEYFNWSTDKMLDGSPYTYKGTNITAYDYGGTTHGSSPMKEALRKSYNTPAIRTLNDVGEVRAREFITKLGMTTEQTLSESIALGLDSSTSQMASAMGTFGQDGVYRPRRYIESIEFSDKSVKEIKFEETQAMRASTAYVITSMLKGVPSELGTMPEGKINGVTHAAKTGTVGYPPANHIPSMASMDLWAVGYTKSLSIAVWQGYDKPMEEGHYISQYFSLNYGHLLYKTIMQEVTKGRDNSDWTMPSTVTKIGNGKGLQADYVPNDLPLVDTEATLEKPIINNRESYENVVKDESLNDYSTRDAKTPQIPKDYTIGQWKEELEKEKEQFNEEHKNDKEEAKIVGEDE